MGYDISAAKGPRSNDKGVWIRAKRPGFVAHAAIQQHPPVKTPEANAARKRMEDKLRSYESALFGGHAERMARGRW